MIKKWFVRFFLLILVVLPSFATSHHNLSSFLKARQLIGFLFQLTPLQQDDEGIKIDMMDSNMMGFIYDI